VKVVLFCGGLGLRMRDYSETIPKPMIKVGYRPILWHLMKYYAHFGHTDFILCLGYRGDVIKDYFLRYEETVSNDFVLERGGKQIELLRRDIDSWRIAFVDTGPTASIGQRLRAVQPYLRGEEVFLANYSDGVTDLDLPRYLDEVERQGKVASFLCVRPNLSLHAVALSEGGLVSRVEPVTETSLRINGGFFVLRREIFEHIGPGEDLVTEPFLRLIEKEQLFGYRYDGFWAAMDTFKDRERLEELWNQGNPPWAVWQDRR
jgi:glucose-1-phosphate cytidylyltransferase